MAVCRPIGIAARSTYTLSVIVISSFCFSVCFLFVLPCLIAALFGTEHLSVACRDKLFVAMRANLCLNDFATVFSDFLCLSLFSVGFFTLALSCQALLFLLLFLCFYLGKFFFGIPRKEFCIFTLIHILDFFIARQQARIQIASIRRLAFVPPYSVFCSISFRCGWVKYRAQPEAIST